MRIPVRRWLNSPKFLVAAIAVLLACVVQSGELGSADTMHRLQTAHSFWTHEPPVFPNEYPEFGAHGRGGRLYDWYGLGQPLLLVPFDIIGTAIENLPIFAEYRGSDPTVRNIFVTYMMNSLISVCTALVCLRLLLLLGFNWRESVAGVLALLFCTTHLHYTQNMMENNYILLLTLTGFYFQYEWLQTANSRALVIGSGAFGLNLLTRLTTGLDLIAGSVFLLLVLMFERRAAKELWPRVRTYLKIAAPLYIFFLFIDRAYHFYRFGSWTNTYVHYFVIEHRLQDPTLPAKYPWETPFHIGFLGPFISPDKSLFMFDPLVVLTAIVVVFGWKRFSASVKAFMIATSALVLATICFYARYTVWSGDFAWGDRYVSSTVELAVFISVPLLLKYRASYSRFIWRTGLAIILISVMVQIASLMFWLPLEIYQADDFGHPQWTIWLRVKNVVAFALGKMDAWGLNTDAMTYDQWDYQHITTWNFLPFVLRRIGAAPAWVADMVLAGWLALLAALFFCLVRLRRVLGHPRDVSHTFRTGYSSGPSPATSTARDSL